MKIVFIYILIMLSSFISNAKIKFIEYNLKNGLHVILHEDNTNPLISVSVIYHVGSKNDFPDRKGFAHFFEHLMFEGSKNIKRGEYFKYIQSNGGISNAYTDKDHTCYFEVIPSNKLKLVLWLESERMLHASVNNVGIDIQRKVVKEEKKMIYDNQPYNFAFLEKAPSLLFKKHPYKFSIIGSVEDLDKSKEDDYKKFYKTFYIPNNAILSISGNLNINETKKIIKYYFNNIPKGKDIVNITSSIKEEPITSEIFSIYKDKNAKVPAVILTYRTPKKTDKDNCILDIISNILSKGDSSRIVKNLINKKQLASSAGTMLFSMEDYSIFTIYAITNNINTNLDQLVESIDEEINNLKNEGIEKKELNKQINFLEKSFFNKKKYTKNISISLSKYYMYFKDTNMINNIIKNYKSISTEDVKRVAKKYLNKNQRVRLYNISNT